MKTITLLLILALASPSPIADREEQSFRAWLAGFPDMPKDKLMQTAVRAAYFSGYRDGIKRALEGK